MSVQAAGATVRIAEWVAALRPADLPPEVVAHAKRLVLDYLAATVVGATTEVSGALRDYLAEAYPGEQATVVGGGRLSAPGAALANGTAAHGLEVDDGYTPGGVHPSSATLPAVLAAAERYECSPEQTMTAAVVAVELASRIAAAGHPATWRNGFHNTPIAGVFGAAAGTAKLLGADPDRLANALGLAGSHAGGLFEFLGSGAEVKRLHAGKAARDGLISAELAMRGITGPTTAFEGEHGYFAAFARGEWDPPTLLDDLGGRWAALRTYIKPYPCCRHLHGPLDAVLELRERHGLRIAEVTGATVWTFTGAARHRLAPVNSFLDAQMSIPYAVAVALRDGEVGLAQFEDGARNDPQVRRITELVDVRASEECDRAYPAMRPAVVEIARRDADPVRLRVDQPYGEPDNPVDDEALTRKFHRLCDPVLGAQRAARVVASAWAFDDVAALTTGLGRVGAGVR